MKIDKSFGRVILLELVSQATGRKPLEFTIDNPRTTYVRMPHGGFSVHILTPGETDLAVELDNVKLLERRLPAGEHTVNTSDSGSLLVFAEPGSKQALALKQANDTKKEPGEVSTSDGNDTATRESVPSVMAPTQGMVIVSVRLTDKTPPNSPQLPPDDASHIFFQLNPPGEHERAMASLLSKVVAPPSTAAVNEFLNQDGTPSQRPVIERHCSCKH